MCRESQTETQRNCTLHVSSHLKCCQSTGSFQCHRTAGQIHLGEKPARQGLLGTLHTLRLPPCRTSTTFAHLCSWLPCLHPQSGCGMLLRPGLPEQTNRTGMMALRQIPRKKAGVLPRKKRRARGVGQVWSKRVSRWAAAAGLVSAQAGLTWGITLQTDLTY